MKKVLVIDDTPEIRMIIGETLEMFGFAVLTADDGEVGIAVAKENLPDLIICDIHMPKMDGFTALSKLRENESTATIPFIFLSGAVERPNVRRGMEMGADDYLTKPFTPSELLAAVNARLEKQAELQRKSDKKLDELRGKMTLALPHELRTPLNGIIGLSSILVEEHATAKPAEILESAQYIHDSALRLQRLVENFLAYAQIELMAKDAQSILATAAQSFVDVAPITVEMAREVAARFKRPQDLHLDVLPAVIPVISDNYRKIVEELVDNAFKFSEPNSRVDVITTAQAQSFSLAVVNRGRGMTPEQIAGVGPHVQFDRDKYEQQGAGLGLAMATRLAELNGGKLEITSRPGAETKVTVMFTASSQPAAGAPPGKPGA